MTTARENNATEGTFTSLALQIPFGEGSFRYVAKGRYVKGDRAGQACVAKWFKTGSVFEDSYFENDLKIFQKAYTIIHRFNALHIIDKTVRLNKPEVWVWADDCSIATAGAKHITEPFIQDYQKFNSNTVRSFKSRFHISLPNSNTHPPITAGLVERRRQLATSNASPEPLQFPDDGGKPAAMRPAGRGVPRFHRAIRPGNNISHGRRVRPDRPGPARHLVLLPRPRV